MKSDFGKHFYDALNESVMSNAGYAINRICKTKIIAIKLMWILSLLIFSSIASYLCVSSIISYYDREIVSKITVYHETPMELPTITFCNLSPFQTNYSLEMLTQMITNTTIYLGSPHAPFGRNSVANKYYFMSNLYDLVKNDSDKMNLGDPLASIIKMCSYDLSNLCTLQDFEWYYDFYYGNCYRFNSKGDKKLYKKGKLAGFHIELYSGYLYSIPWQSEAGMHIFVHNKSHKISMYQGIDAPIGKMTNIAINRIYSNKLEMPYSECVEDLEKEGSKYYEILTNHNFTYQRSDCIELCFSDYAFQKIGCREGLTSIFYDETVCKTLEQIVLLANILSEFYNTKTFEQCNCPLECHSISYSLSTSFSSFFNAVNAKNQSSTDENPNTLALNIYFEELKYTIIDEKIKTNWVDLISSIGGVPFLIYYELYIF